MPYMKPTYMMNDDEAREYITQIAARLQTEEWRGILRGAVDDVRQLVGNEHFAHMPEFYSLLPVLEEVASQEIDSKDLESTVGWLTYEFQKLKARFDAGAFEYPPDEDD